MTTTMSYKILSLKWRPTSFDQISGQDHITQTLINAISSNRLAQAFLFSGPRGVGKTTAARVLAAKINNIDDYSKCLDIIELDGASNRGIDEIREIRESVKFAPSMAKYKVYIIDEAHMLTEQAFNALLKTLEEPPEYIIFVLATTDPQKMPQTILSRTQRYDFVRIPVDVISDRLKYILNAEEINYEENAIQLISKKADGSMRDALSILDQVIAYSDELVSVDNLRLAIGLINEEDIYELMLSIVSKDFEAISLKFNNIIDSGISTNNFINDMCSFLNDCMLIKININSNNIHLSEDLKTRIDTNIPLGYKDVLQMLNMALSLSNRIKKTDNPKILLEVLMIKYASMIRISNSGDSNAPKNLPSKKESDDISSKQDSLNNQNKAVNDKIESKVTSSVNDKEINNDRLDVKDVKGNSEQQEVSDEDVFKVVNSNWNQILEKLDTINSKLSSFLEEVTIKGFQDNTLLLSLDEGNDFIKKVLDSDSKIITNMINEDYGFSIKIQIELAEKKDSDTQSINKEDSIEEEHPLLDDAIKIFNGKIIS